MKELSGRSRNGCDLWLSPGGQGLQCQRPSGGAGVRLREGTAFFLAWALASRLLRSPGTLCPHQAVAFCAPALHAAAGAGPHCERSWPLVTCVGLGQW